MNGYRNSTQVFALGAHGKYIKMGCAIEARFAALDVVTDGNEFLG